MTDVVLTRTALSGLSAATETMDGLERELLRLRVNDEEEGRSAWEDAWLETGIAIVRADSAVRTARSRGDESSLAPDDARWMRQQLGALGDRWEERYRAVADRLEGVGLRLHALGTLALPAAPPADPPPDRHRETIPAAAPEGPGYAAPRQVSVAATTPATDAPAELQGAPGADSPPPAAPSERPTGAGAEAPAGGQRAHGDEGSGGGNAAAGRVGRRAVRSCDRAADGHPRRTAGGRDPARWRSHSALPPRLLQPRLRQTRSPRPSRPRCRLALTPSVSRARRPHPVPRHAPPDP